MSQARTDSIYWDVETKAKAETLARAEQRSLSNLLRTLVIREYDLRHPSPPLSREATLVEGRR